MPRIAPGPLDVRRANLSAVGAVQVADGSRAAASVAQISQAVEKVLNTARDQQIENDVARAELLTRRDLDALRVKLDEDPDNETLVTRWTEGAREVVERNASRLGSPMHQRLWRSRADALIESERRGMENLRQTRIVESARAGLIDAVGQAQITMTDANASPQARAEAFTIIETAVNRAVERRTITADAGARMIQAANAAQAEFASQQGLIVQAQTEEDRIWAESGGDLATALELTRELSGPLRDSVENRIEQRFSQAQTARNQSIDDAMGRAYAAIEQGVTLDQFAASNPGDTAVITQRGQMDTLRSYQRSRVVGSGAGVEVTNRLSEARREGFLALAEEPDTAREFANLDLYAPLEPAEAAVLGLPAGQSVAQNLQPDDLRALRQRQRELRGEEPMGDSNQTIVNRAYTLLRNYAEPVAQARGVGLSDREEDRKTTMRFRGFLLREARDFVEANNRLPTQREIQEITDTALLQSRGGLFNSTQRRVFEGGEGREVRVPYSLIPEYQQRRLMRQIIASGREFPETPEGAAAAERAVEEAYMLQRSE